MFPSCLLSLLFLFFVAAFQHIETKYFAISTHSFMNFLARFHSNLANTQAGEVHDSEEHEDKIKKNTSST